MSAVQLGAFTGAFVFAALASYLTSRACVHGLFAWVQRPVLRIALANGASALLFFMTALVRITASTPAQLLAAAACAGWFVYDLKWNLPDLTRPPVGDLGAEHSRTGPQVF